MKKIFISAVILTAALSTTVAAQDNTLAAQARRACGSLTAQAQSISLDSLINITSTSVGAALGASCFATAGDGFRGNNIGHAIMRNGDFYAGATFGGMIGKFAGYVIISAKNYLHTPAKTYLFNPANAYLFTPCANAISWVRNAFGNRLEAVAKAVKTN